MKTSRILLSAALLGFAASATAENVSQYVEPRIGTAHCRWFHIAPGALPFGMAKPGPSTNGHLGNEQGWEASGYDYRESSIEGFPCIHEFQLGGISLMPTKGELITYPGEVDNTEGRGYRSFFDRENETARPGYYSVLLKRYGILAETTATDRTAYERFTFPAGDDNHILFDIGSRQGESGAVADAKVELRFDGSIEGYVVTLPEYVKKYQAGAEVPIYFSAVVDRRPSAYGTFNGEKSTPGAKVAQGPGAGLYLTFATEGEATPVTVKIGLSYTSVDNARLNRLAESKNLDFDTAAAKAADIWEEMLSRITVETPSKTDKVKFYTGLYHAILGRGLANDINGAYPRNDGSVGYIPMTADGKPRYNFYNTDAAWGAQWNLSQIWALAYPEYFSDYVSTHLRVFADSGWLGDGLAASRYVSGVGTNLLPVIISGAYHAGITDFDTDLALKACLKNELCGENRPFGAGKSDTDKFVKYGYVPHADEGSGFEEEFRFSASHTLEYSYSSWATSQLARSLGKTEHCKQLDWLAEGWERIYDDQAGFMHPRMANGKFIDNFNPMQVWRGFQEGNAWQYTFYVPHQADRLIAKVGRDRFNERLDSIFTVSQDKIFSGGTEVGAFAGLQTLYNQGNQPCLHISWLFNESGRPSLSQKWVRAILDRFYGIDGIHGYGYGQDEDQGQLGAWYVLSSMGLFDVKGFAGQNPDMAVGSPKFDKITLRLSPRYHKGKEFVITTEGNSDSNVYVAEASFNGEKMSALRLPLDKITEGGHLHLKMSSTPRDNYAD
ncbi:MAG: GH92 family glycosyl hydrolase [Muribaculaceae bacterium]|nr:GH92 family glycosyl hydrolase [Muribaculaceae bacterium]